MSLHKGLIGKTEGGGSVGFDRIPAVHMPVNVPQSDMPRVVSEADKTLSDYIQRKTRQEAFNFVAGERHLTFAEWFWERTKEFDEGLPVSWEDFELVAHQAWEASK